MERLEEIDEEKAATSKIPDGFSLNSKEFGLDLGLQHFRMDSSTHFVLIFHFSFLTAF